MSETTTPDSTDDHRVLTVRVGSAEKVFDDLEECFAALDAGERPEPQFEVVLQREADLERVLRPTNVELLRTIARDEPASIREAAQLVERDVRQVHDNLVELERIISSDSTRTAVPSAHASGTTKSIFSCRFRTLETPWRRLDGKVRDVNQHNPGQGGLLVNISHFFEWSI